MEKYFGNAYRGDPGVPHADQDRFVNIWIGSFAFSAFSWLNPYLWQLPNQFNPCIWAHAVLLTIDGQCGLLSLNKDPIKIFIFKVWLTATIVGRMGLMPSMFAIVVHIYIWHDKAMLFEHYHWKKALQKKQPYKFKWNQMDKEIRDSYYFNWPVYFP